MIQTTFIGNLQFYRRSVNKRLTNRYYLPLLYILKAFVGHPNYPPLPPEVTIQPHVGEIPRTTPKQGKCSSNGEFSSNLAKK